MSSPQFDDKWAHEFPLEPGLSYLNHAAVSPWPARTRDAISAFASENSRTGARDYARWLEVEHRLRRQIQALLGARSLMEIAFQKNTSEGLSTIARGLRWSPGDEVVIPSGEFPSNRIVWESLASRGVSVIRRDLDPVSPEQSLLDAITPRTRLMSVSSVQYGDGFRLHLDVLGTACRDRGVLFCVDAIQSLGVLPFDVEACCADFVVANGHKWLLSPEGLALLYVREARLAELDVHEYGWHMVKHRGDYSRQDWELAPGARRFECGSPNLLATMGMSQSLGLLEEAGMDHVTREISQRVAYLASQLAEIDGIEVLTPMNGDRRAGIVTCRSHRLTPEQLQQGLAAAGVICAQRGGGIRLSPHFYTPRRSLDQALDTLRRMHR
jgi:cysteine desulfurase/selenocysteine lyase